MMWGTTPLRLTLGTAMAAGFLAVSAVAQEQASPKKEEAGVLEDISRWLDKQVEGAKSTFQDAGKGVKNFGHEAGVAAKTTADGAKEAADSLAKIPNARVVTGHQKCGIAPNGAPDCIAAATAMCKTQGFASGKSADMTTAETCPAQVYLSGRNSGPGCKTETFVSRALCQ